MNNDRVEGKVKDIAGRVERQVGEWTGDKEAQAKGIAKQAEGKVQNTWGKVKDAAGVTDKPAADVDTNDDVEQRRMEREKTEREKKAS